jgi:gliding motility-associated-like protein
MSRFFRALLVSTLFAILAPQIASRAQSVSFTSSISPIGCRTVTLVLTPTITGCSGSSVPTFTWFLINTSTGAIDSVSTRFLVRTLTSIGTYDVILRATCDSLVLFDTARGFATVNPAPTISFSTTDPAVDTVLGCTPRTIRFVNTTTSDTSCPSRSWLWNITGPGGFSYRFSGSAPTYTFTTPGEYTVQLFYFAFTCGCDSSVIKTAYIKVDSPSTACARTVGTTAFCAPPATVTYDASCSIGPVSRYEWHFGDGTTVTTTDSITTHTFTRDGIYSDTLYVYSPGGCVTRSILSNSVRIGSIVAAMAVAPDTVCQGTLVTFADSSTVGGTPASYKFTLVHVGTGTVAATATSGTASFMFSYPPPYDAGLYRIIDTVTDGSGCISTTSRTIFVRVSPRITSLTLDSTYKCAPPMLVRFTSTVSPGPPSAYRYTWAFGGGAAASTSGIGLTAATRSYTSTGTFSPMLTITDRHGCSDDTSATGAVAITAPRIRLSLLVDSGCAPIAVRYSVGIVTPIDVPFTVDSVVFGDGSAPCIGAACEDSVHTYTTSGRYGVVAYGRIPAGLGGCTAFDSTTLLISADTPSGGIRITDADSVCPRSTVRFFDSCSTCTSRTWTIQNDEGAVTSFTDTTSAFMLEPSTCRRWTLIRSLNGCADTNTGCIFVRPPAAGFIQRPRVFSCNRRDSVEFTIAGTTPGLTGFKWYIIGPIGSSAFRVDSATGNPLVYDFRRPDRRVRVGVFKIVAIDSGGPANAFCTNYTDTFEYRFDTGKVDTFVADDYEVCIGQTVTFSGRMEFAASGGAPASPYSRYEWSWGDGTPDAVITPSTPTDTATTHVFTLPGRFTVRLVVVNGSGCRDTFRTRIIDVSGPTGGLRTRPEPVCVGSPITFVALNTTRVGSIVRPRKWMMDEGRSISTDGIPINTPFDSFTYTYPRAGTYTVSLSDSDSRGCTSRTSQTVNVVKPRSTFFSMDTVDNLCANIPITFRSNERGVTYAWNFGDGSGWTTPSASDSVISHTYSRDFDSFYTVRLVVASLGSGGIPTGCTDTLVKSRYIHIQKFRYTSTNYGDAGDVACPPLRLVKFADSIGGIPPDFIRYTWTVATSTTSSSFTGLLLNTTVFTPGRVTVTLTGTTLKGCVDTEVSNFFVGGPSGVITVSPDSGCVPITATFTFRDTSGSTLSSRFIWTACPVGSFITTSPTATLPYTVPGTYCPPSIVITSGSCAVTINGTDSIRVFPYPNLSISPDPLPVLCYGTSAIITANSDQPITSYTWSPATAISCTDCPSPTVGPLVNTTYAVSGSTIHGCADTATILVQVDSQLFIRFKAKERVCIGVCDTIVAYGVRGGLYAWEGVGISCAVCDTNIICINQTRTFTVTATNPNGCQTTDSVKLIVDPLPILNVLPSPAFVCKYSPPTQLQITGAQSYVWRPRLGLSCDSCSNPLVDITTNIIYSVVGTTQYGCKDSISIPVVVYDTTVTAINSDTSICIGDRATLNAEGGVSYLWRPGNSLDDSTKKRPSAFPIATTIYTVVITENVCFKDTLTVKVRVVPIPTIKITPASAEIKAGDKVPLSVEATNETELRNFLWTPSDTTLTCFQCPRPIASPLSTTTYRVFTSTIEGCAAESEMTIRVLCAEDQVFIPNTFTPNGDGNNDRFYISGKGLGNVRRLTVFNRWGEQIFEANNVRSNDPGTGWDGTYKGEILPPDVFMYLLEVQCSNGELFKFKGDISLVR